MYRQSPPEGEFPMIRRIFGCIVFVVLLLGNGASAHHNMTALFDFNDRVTVTGTLTKIDWRNPHIYLTIDVKNAKGSMENWQGEGPAPSWFRIRDVGKTDFEKSIEKILTLELSRARDKSLSGLIRTITLPDGKVLSACPQNC
jgi:Family of unknown function (DUF6152)